MGRHGATQPGALRDTPFLQPRHPARQPPQLSEEERGRAWLGGLPKTSGGRRAPESGEPTSSGCQEPCQAPPGVPLSLLFCLHLAHKPRQSTSSHWSSFPGSGPDSRLQSQLPPNLMPTAVPSTQPGRPTQGCQMWTGLQTSGKKPGLITA